MSVADELTRAGMSDTEARRKDELAAAALDALGGATQHAVFGHWVPGRIEFVGKHTDYAGGRSLVCAVEQGIVVAARRRDDRAIRVADAVTRDSAELALERDVDAPQGHWTNYPATVARRIARNFPDAAHGADIAFASDLPRAAGLSSSSALVVATFLSLAAVNDLAESARYRDSMRSDEDLAAYLGTVENGMPFRALAGESGVGTFGGSEDHAAILCGTAGALTQLSFCPLRAERTVELPNGYQLVIASSGVVAEKTGAAREAYNHASRAAAEALERLRASSGVGYSTLADAIDALGMEGIATLPFDLRARAEQFARESTIIVPGVADALARDDLATVGTLVDASQHLAERLLRNQVPETVALAASARELGAVAASAFGAGFGGSVWALVADSRAKLFMDEWRADYLSRFPERASAASFFTTRAGPHACKLDLR